MAVCNLFRKLSKQTGEFLMFSQYAEDLTRNNSQGYNYRVTPSRFIAANIDFSKFNKYVGEGLNISFPKYLQNYFENGCAVCKNKKGMDWNPEISSNLFWNAMIECGLINIVKSDEDISSYIDEFKWIDEINIQSYDKMNGMGYSEIYCYIPNSAKHTHYGCSEYIKTDAISSSKTSIEGYNISEFNDNMLSGEINSDINYYPKKSINFYHDNKDYRFKTLGDDKFDINCIIVLYDINNINDDGSSSTIYKNIPMGIYLPGCFEGNIVQNSITKWVHNSDIYNSGTSYGIRICSRFSITPNLDNIKEVEVNSINQNEYESMSQIMGEIANNLQEMTNITKDAVFKSSSLKDTLAIFKNSRTNVPYIIDLNGTKYWFINGRNTNVVVPDGTKYSGYTKEEMTGFMVSLIGINEALRLTANIIDPATGRKTYLKKENPSGLQTLKEDILIEWNLIDRYTGAGIDPDLLYLKLEGGTDKDTINGEESIKNNNKGIGHIRIPKESVTNDCKYICEATVVLDSNNLESSELIKCDLPIKFCLPIYFGLISSSIDSETGADNIDDIIENIKHNNIDIKDVQGIKEIILPSASNKVYFTSNGKRIVYACPEEYGEINSILNRNSMDEIIHDFEHEIINVNFNGVDIKYNLYYTTNNTGSGIDSEFDFIDNSMMINDIIYYYNSDIKYTYYLGNDAPQSPDINPEIWESTPSSESNWTAVYDIVNKEWKLIKYKN